VERHSVVVGTRGILRTNLPHMVWACAFCSHQAALNPCLPLLGLLDLTSDALMEVQIFGVKKSTDTRKALRFFSERRIRTHFVDLMERAISEGELQRFVQRFGLPALLDPNSKRIDELGLRHSQQSPSRWLERLAEEPTLLRLPLVRK